MDDSPKKTEAAAATASMAPKRLSGNLEGALWMLVSGVGFTVYVVLAKLMSSDVHPMVLAFFRAFFGLLIMAPLLIRRGPSFFVTDRLGLIVVRSLFGTFGFILSLLAISDFFALPLSQFNAVSFSRPLFVTMLAALLLGEHVGFRRWCAVAIGFVGVLVMVVPEVVFFWMPDRGDTTSFDLGTILALGSAFAFAGAIVLVKSLSATHSPAQLLAWANLLSTLMLLPLAIWYWSMPSLANWVLILAMSLAGLGAQYCYVRAMSMGDASFLSPMDYLRLPMTAVADWWLFRLLPGVYVWLGAAIIIASTLYITLREARRRP